MSTFVVSFMDWHDNSSYFLSTGIIGHIIINGIEIYFKIFLAAYNTILEYNHHYSIIINY